MGHTHSFDSPSLDMEFLTHQLCRPKMTNKNSATFYLLLWLLTSFVLTLPVGFAEGDTHTNARFYYSLVLGRG